MEKIDPFGGWGELSKRMRKWAEDGCPEEKPWKFCRCPIPDSDWSFSGWHMCRDSHGNETAYERCPEYLEHHTKTMGDGTVLTFSIQAEDPHKVDVYKQAGGSVSATRASIIE